MQYVQIRVGAKAELPEGPPFRAVLIADAGCSDEQRAEVSRAIINAGCLYLMSWGEGCRAWQDAVNLANLQAYEFGAIPDDKLIITTSHPDETLEQTFWFAKHTAMHPCDPLERVMIIHMTPNELADKEMEMLAAYAAA
ncbi:MAG: DUF7684 family protein [Gammaproteobacteria bacterium]